MPRLNFSGRLFGSVAAVACLLVGGTVVPVADAQTPTAEQMEMFQNLPPEQQQAIMESMGGGDPSRPTDRVRSDRQLKFPQTVRPRSRDGSQDADEDTDTLMGVREPRFKGDDTVLLSLGIRQYAQWSAPTRVTWPCARERAPGQCGFM